MHIIGAKSRQRHDTIYIKIATDNVQGVKKTMVTSKFPKFEILDSYDVISHGKTHKITKNTPKSIGAAYCFLNISKSSKYFEFQFFAKVQKFYWL